ncbi:hypothetical protein O181_059541 [Austropuccinia psidii MF-1]|uniref:Uncharacterized protein n=1 Tax=Austropuccinia psidii MF-1 TaxID=1389203 RepID=A0A9Q3ECE0_9BASI|nr:hypothetical protein [Austropuccinia psidii MF-1]
MHIHYEILLQLQSELVKLHVFGLPVHLGSSTRASLINKGLVSLTSSNKTASAPSKFTKARFAVHTSRGISVRMVGTHRPNKPSDDAGLISPRFDKCELVNPESNLQLPPTQGWICGPKAVSGLTQIESDPIRPQPIKNTSNL